MQQCTQSSLAMYGDMALYEFPPTGKLILGIFVRMGRQCQKVTHHPGLALIGRYDGQTWSSLNIASPGPFIPLTLLTHSLSLSLSVSPLPLARPDKVHVGQIGRQLGVPVCRPPVHDLPAVGAAAAGGEALHLLGLPAAPLAAGGLAAVEALLLPGPGPAGGEAEGVAEQPEGRWLFK